MKKSLILVLLNAFFVMSANCGETISLKDEVGHEIASLSCSGTFEKYISQQLKSHLEGNFVKSISMTKASLDLELMSFETNQVSLINFDKTQLEMQSGSCTLNY